MYYIGRRHHHHHHRHHHHHHRRDWQEERIQIVHRLGRPIGAPTPKRKDFVLYIHFQKHQDNYFRSFQTMDFIRENYNFYILIRRQILSKTSLIYSTYRNRIGDMRNLVAGPMVHKKASSIASALCWRQFQLGLRALRSPSSEPTPTT